MSITETKEEDIMRSIGKYLLRSIVIISLLLPSIGHLQAQVLNQDKDGNSSIVGEGTTGGIEVVEGLIKFNHYFNPRGHESTLLGIDLQGKDKSGLANLFQSDKFTPSAKGSFLFGKQWISYVNHNSLVDRKARLVASDHKTTLADINNLSACPACA